MQLGEHWFVRDAGYKLNEKGELFDLSDAPFTEKPIAVENDTDATKAERQRLSAALADLNPSTGKTDTDGGAGFARRNRVATTSPSGDAPTAGSWALR